MTGKPTLTIAITGHRNLNAEKLGLLEPVLKKAISNIIFYAKSIQGIAPVVTFNSLMAAGADTLFANVVIKYFNGDLKIYLPFEEKDYLKDFNAEGKREFKALLKNGRVSEVVCLDTIKNNERESLYLQAGQKVVDDNEYIIAIWNEKPANGKGGTAEVVEYALKKKKNILIINPEETSLRIKLLPELGYGKTPKKFAAAEPGLAAVDVYFNYYDSAAIRGQLTYRAIWRWCFLFGWVAACIIALKIALKETPLAGVLFINPENLQFYLTVFEIFSLLVIFALIRVEKRESYHSKYLQNRFIAETFRINRLIYYCGLYPFKVERKVIHKTLQNFEIMNPVQEINKIIILTAYTDAPVSHKKTLLKSFAIGQCNYHRARRERLLKTNRINTLGKYACFLVFIIILIYHAIHDFAICPMCAVCFSNSCKLTFDNSIWFKWADPVSIFLYLFLPVTIARLEAMKYLYDWEKLITQSKYMSDFFANSAKDVDKVTDDDSLCDVLKVLNENMFWENLDWEMFMQDKNEFSY